MTERENPVKWLVMDYGRVSGKGCHREIPNARNEQTNLVFVSRKEEKREEKRRREEKRKGLMFPPISSLIRGHNDLGVDD